MIKKTITLSANSIQTDQDSDAMQLLQTYCYRMKIQMDGVQINNRLHLKFTGDEYQIEELKQYLENKKNNE